VNERYSHQSIASYGQHSFSIKYKLCTQLKWVDQNNVPSCRYYQLIQPIDQGVILKEGTKEILLKIDPL